MAKKKQPAPYLAERQAVDLEAGERFIASLQQAQPEQREGSGFMRRALGDTGIALLKGAIAVPEAAVGLADLVTGGGAGRMAEAAGFRPREAKAMLDEYLTPEQQAANREVQQADGFMGKLGAAVANPSVIGQAVAEALPSMGAGGVVGRGLTALAPRMGTLAAGAVGEGVITAGQGAEQVRQEDPNGQLTGGQSAIMALSGGATALLSRLSGGIANRLGIGDIDQLMVQAAGAKGSQAIAAQQVQKGIARKALEGFVSEGLLEELPQSVQEQVAQNLAQGKPLDEGVDYAAVMGLLTGGVMGAGAAPLARPSLSADSSGPTPGDDLRAGKMAEVGPMTRALNAAVESAAQKADAGEPVPAVDPATGQPVPPEAAAPAATAAPAADAPPAIDFERVLADMHQWAADDLQSTRQFGPGGAAPAQMAPATVISEVPSNTAPAADILSAKGVPFKSEQAARKERARQGDPGAFDIAPVEGGFVVRPIQGFSTDGTLAADGSAGPADAGAVSRDLGVAEQPAVGPGSAGDAAAPVDGAAPGGDAAGLRPGLDAPQPAAELTPAPAAPAAAPAEDAPEARWTRMTTADRGAVLERAGWAVGAKPSLSAQRMLALPWAKMNDSQRKRITAALEPEKAGAAPVQAPAAAPAPGRSNKQIGASFKRMAEQARDDLEGVLSNWNGAELSEDGDRIVNHIGRDRYYSKGKDGGKVGASKAEFLNWLFSDAPLDAKQLQQDDEWRGQIARLRALATENGTGAPSPETAALAPAEVTSSQQPLSDEETADLERMLGHNGAVSTKDMGGHWMAEATGGNLRTPVRSRGSTQDAARRNLLASVRQAREQQAAEPTAAPAAAAPAPEPAAAPTPAVKPSANTVFTEDMAAAARARLKAKLNRASSGVDPETLMDGITLAGYHIEKGARTFAAYARAMVDDLGDAVKPYLQSWYMAVRADPRAVGFKDDMDKASAVEDIDVDQVLADSGTTPAAAPAQNAAKEAPNAEPAQPQQLPDADPAQAQPDATAGGGDSQPVAPGVAGAGEDAAGGGRVPGSAEDAGGGGKGSAGERAGKAPRAPRNPAGARAQPGTADDFDLTGEDIGTGGLTRKYRDNIAAIKILKALEAEGRKSTADERKKLARYVGWGALKGVFDHANKQWAKEHAELKELLTDAEWQAAAASVRNAHYTSPVVVKGMVDLLARLGVTKGRLLEPSVGSGNFFGFMPDQLRKAMQLFGIELDPITSKIAAGLYPSAKIINSGFEDYEIPGGFFDVAVGNPPFGNEPLVDLERRPYSGFSIHNYFFAKTIDKLRPGGVMAMVVSHNFLDALDGKAREWIAPRARLVSAVRLPRTAFKENAGTEVVTDIVVFQKTDAGERTPAWLEVGEQTNTNAKTGDEVKHRVNRYFLDNPQNVLGTPSASGTMYGANEYTVEPSGDLAEQLAAWVKTLPEGIYQPIDRTEQMVDSSVPDGVKVGSFFVAEDGSVKIRDADVMGERRARAWTPPNDKAAERVKGMAGLRDALRSQMRLERSRTATEAEIEAGRTALNGLYDKFQKAYGYLNDPTNRRLFLDDTEANLLLALEFDYDKGVSDAVAEREGIEARKPSATKADIFKRRVLFPPSDDMKVGSARDALLASLNYKGTLDLPYMERLYGKKADAIVDELGELVFREPGGGIVTADEYLSGDVKTKLAEAEAAARSDAAMARNVEALRKVIPADKKPSEIHAAIGAKFVPADVLEEFAKRISGDTVVARYVKSLGQWVIQHNGSGDPVLNRAKWGTAQLSALDILSSTIAGKTVIVTRTVRNGDGSTTTVVMEKETEAARGKQQAIKDEWQTWLWSDGERTQRLVGIYNEEMNRWVERRYDGSHLTLPGKVPDDVIALLDHQKNGVWRALQSRQILLDHVVGAGKTFQMVAIAMELRRTGVARKPMFAVPNHLTLQWRSEFARMYPGANVLAATPEDFSKGNRERFFSKIITGDWDAVIVGHSSLKKIALPPETEKAILEEQVAELSDAIEEMKRQRGDKRIVADMQGIKKRLEGKMKEKLAALGNRDKVVTFDELGVDAMFVDELHEFKNLYYNSTMDRVAGMGNPAGSDKGFDLFVKLQWLFNTMGEQAPIVGATGTPVSNSLVEMFNMQRFMQYPTLKREGLHVFDAWARQFGAVENVYEVAPSGTGYRSSTRFGKFKNLPALMTGHYLNFADVVTLDDLKAQEERQGKRFPVPKLKGGRPQIVVAERSPLVADFMGVPRLEMGEDGQPRFGFNPEAGEAMDITEEKEGFKVERVVPTDDGKEVRLAVGIFKTRPEADMKVVELGLSPKITVDPESILGRFGRLKELMRQTKGKVNALSLTGAANKAGLDYRLINPAAPDFPGSKINKAVDNMMAEYERWKADKGTQLVFCDLSVPLSERSSLANKAQRLYVREDGALVHKKGTMHTVEGSEELPFFVVQRGAKDTKVFDLYDAASGLLLKGGNATKAAAVQYATEVLADEERRQKWIDARESTGEITQEQIDDYNDANEIDTEESPGITLQDIAGVSGASKFSVYDDIKAKLIRRGVPAQEIAFIHDYATPTAKDKLFKAVKRGDVRFLLGSTPKMGAGTNVQDRAVALHHIDAPWRPSDLEQREGRVIRRGNKLYERDPDGFEVGIYRYATQQTYDTRRWQILEHKARGIEQLRNYDGTTNEIDDIDGEAANAADMKAAASGDPLILKETQLRNELKRLETSAAAHVDQVQDMLRRAKFADDWVRAAAPVERKAITDQVDTAGRYPVPEEGMPGGSEVDGKAFADKKEYTQALARAVAEAVTGKSKFTLQYRGLLFRFEADGPFGARLYQGGSEFNSIGSWGEKEAISASGIVQRLQNYVERLPGLVVEHDAQVKRAVEQAAGMRLEAKKPYPDADLLVKTREAHKRVQRLLIARGPEVPADEKPILEQAQERQKEALREAGFGEALDELLAFKGDTQAGDDVALSRGRGAGGLDLESARALATRLEAQGVVRLNVVQSIDDLPKRHREKVLTSAPNGQVRGAYFRQGDSIWLIADQLRGADEFVEVALHEAFHRGLARTIPATRPLLRGMHRSNAALRAATAEQMRQHKIGQDEAIEEALAVMAQAGRARDLKGWGQLLETIRAWLAKLANAVGVQMTWTDDMVADFVAGMTRAGLQGGTHVNTAQGDQGARLGRVPQGEAFLRWFGDSKVVDAEGKPLVVYHGTTTPKDFGKFKAPAYFSSRPEGAQLFGEDAAMQDVDVEADGSEIVIGSRLIPVHLAIRNPMRVRDWGEFMEWDARRRTAAEKQGYDGATITMPDGEQMWIAFRPEQIKSAIGNRGTFDPASVDIRLSRAGDAIDTMRSALTARSVQERANDLLTTSKAFNWWHRTVGTQFHKAKTNPQFRAVYDAAQAYLHDTSAFANDAADLAPELLPQLKTVKDIGRALSMKEADRKALAAAVFEGTLTLARNEDGEIVDAGEGGPAGVVFTPAELKSRYGFNDEQVGMYQQFRRATDRSLDILGAADVARLLGDGLPPSIKAMVSQGDVGRFRGLVSSFTKQMKAKAEADLAAVRKRHRNQMGAFWRKQKAELEGPRGRAGARLALLEELEAEKNALKLRLGGEKYRAEQEAKQWTDLERTVREKFERIDQLKAQGYAPLMRFGRYTVDVVSKEGEREFFFLYETEREANAAARRMRADYPDSEVTQGVMSEEAHKQFSGMTPETLELFAELSGLEKTPLFQEYLRRAKGNRSALKRLIKRKGVAGYSEDLSRVLAGFITSNGRAAASNLHMGSIARAAEDIPKEAGDVKDEALRLKEYVQNPQEEAQALRGLLFAQYLGGSVASAMVNMTQPLMMTFPYLSQFGGPVKAGARLLAAVKGALGAVDQRSDLGRALALAEKEGIVSPQELHQLQAQVTRSLGNHPALRRWAFVWGSLFSLSEQFNRRISFIAAFNTAKEQGIADPFKFAASAVDETQGVYNKGNRPNWARGAVGATIFTFKQYSISYMEFLTRLPRKERLLALAILLLAAGAQGLPGADDLDDLIDTIGQQLDYDINSKLWKTRVLEEALGEAGADFVLRGFSALPGFPLDVSGRLGLGNLVPGTGMLLKSKADKAGEVAEAFGPAASTAVNTAKALPALFSGDIVGFNKQAGTTASKNLMKAIEMYQTGEYRDGAGRMVREVTKFDAVVKGIGFQPAEVARDTRQATMARQQIDMAKAVKSEISAKWAQGIVEKDPAMVQEARARLAKWNRDNPNSRIGINAATVGQRVRQMRMTRDQRLEKAAPRTMRGAVAEIVE